MSNFPKFLIKKIDIFNYILLLIVAIAIAAGFLIGIAISNLEPVESHIHQDNSLRLTGTEFTKPLLLADGSNQENSPELEELTHSIKNAIEGAKNDGKISEASVYFRILDTGVQASINSDEKYLPASLIKVPLMMTYLKASETDPGLLTTRGVIGFEDDFNKDQEIKPTKFPVSGGEYSIDELIDMMIRYSDNNGYALLSERPGALSQLEKLYSDFKLYYPLKDAPHDVITPIEFSRFLRALYNSTYLNVANSEKALTIMSQTDYDAGITAGVPKDVKVANKYGLSSTLDAVTSEISKRQLHDCGIIYKPRQHYVLCVMTKSEPGDINEIESVIADVSKQIYDYIDAN